MRVLGFYVFIGLALTAGGGELPVVWQRFYPISATNGTPAEQTLTVATVAFDANEPVNGKGLVVEDRVRTNLLSIARIIRQVTTACAKKGGIYAKAPILVAFPEASIAGINETDASGRRSWRDFRDGVMGWKEFRDEAEWARYFAGKPYPNDSITCGLRDIATNQNVYLSCSYETRDAEGRYRNVCTLFGPEKSQFGAPYGVIGYHYKVHPVGGEREVIARGDEFRVWPTKVGHIGMMICYDIMFPESARAFGVGGADLVLASTAWLRYYPEGFPDGQPYAFGPYTLTRDTPGLAPDGKDDGCRTFIDMAIRTAAFQNGYYFAISSLANPGGFAYSSIVYPSGRVLCETLGERLPGEVDDAEAKYRPGIAIANIGFADRAHELSVSEIIRFNPFEDRNTKAYGPLIKDGGDQKL